ncbi:MAG: MmgE/PrpD family protein, partial [Betaproteobacteria bacterium]|nr:MmgE/PrpD family protein [Betaproteobacteria bacterium]
MDATNKLARFATDTRYEDLPDSVRHAAKRIILDTIGCVFGAVGTTPGLAVRQVVKMQGGDGATVLGTGQRAGVMTAAYANGRLANLLDFDECYMVQGHHAQSTLGAALALCEEAGKSGKDLIAAFAVGFETGIRFGGFLSPRVSVGDDGKAVGWTGLAGPGQGVYAACAATSNLWGLPPDQVSQAFGLCAQYMVGRDWNRQWGTDVELGTIKYADTGWNAQAGMMAALAAREEVTGIKHIFDRESFAQVFKGVILKPEALTEKLGERWFVQNTSIKFWPCCRWIHYALTGFAELIQEHRLSAEEIQSVELCSFPVIPNPSFTNQQPVNLVAAGMSFPHAAAMVALDVPAGPEWFAPAQMTGERAKAFRNKVEFEIDPAGYDPNAWGLGEGVLKVPSFARIKARGAEFRRASLFALGDPWDGA